MVAPFIAIGILIVGIIALKFFNPFKK